MSPSIYSVLPTKRNIEGNNKAVNAKFNGFKAGDLYICATF